MKKIVKASSGNDRTFRVYFTDGNQMLAGGIDATVLDVVEYLLAKDSRYTAADICKVEEV